MFVGWKVPFPVVNQLRFYAAPAGDKSAAQLSAQYARNLPEHEKWRADAEKYPDLQRLPGGRQWQKDFKMGPYAHRMVVDEKGKVTPKAVFFVSPKKDPVTFIVNTLCVVTVVWTISQLSWGESFFEKRKRVIREKIRREYGLPKGWEHDIEDADDLPLSDELPGVNLA